mgnify:CR=1 FL=1
MYPNRKFYWRMALAVLLLFMLVTPAVAQVTTTITLQDTTILPLSLAYDATSGRFFMGTRADGTVYVVAADGTTQPFITDSALTSASALYIDTARNWLFVLDSGFGGMMGMGGFGGQGQPPEGGQGQGQPPAGGQGQGQPPADSQFPQSSLRLFAFDLATAATVLDVDLAAVAPDGPKMATSIAVDKDGFIYVTDSLAGVIYRVDSAGNALYLADQQFASQMSRFEGGQPPSGDTGQGQGQPPADDQGQGMGLGRMGGFGLSAIVYHPDGLLIVVKSDDNTLYKIPLDNPQNVTPITVAPALTAANRLALLADGRLAVISAQDGTVNILTSSDAWSTASVSATLSAGSSITALTASGQTLYLLQVSAAASSDSQSAPLASSAIVSLAVP